MQIIVDDFKYVIIRDHSLQYLISFISCYKIRRINDYYKYIEANF